VLSHRIQVALIKEPPAGSKIFRLSDSRVHTVGSTLCLFDSGISAGRLRAVAACFVFGVGPSTAFSPVRFWLQPVQVMLSCV
jgi:hypothetical protein